MSEYEIDDISRLKPLEKVFPNHLRILKSMIFRDGFIRQAIIADKMTGIVLDGSHRYVFFLMEGFKTVPVHYVDYTSEHISVGTLLLHRFLVKGPIGISKQEVLIRGMSGELFEPRTTRHFFPFLKQDINVPLISLKRGSPVDISKFVSDVDISTEIAHNYHYIQEIEDEFAQIIYYLYNVQATKKYLEEQISRMEAFQ